MPRVQDGIFVPSHFGLASSGARSATIAKLNNHNSSLHVGYTVAVHYPGEPGYETSKEAVYDIAAPVANGVGGWQWQIYNAARVASNLGGSTNDFTRFKLQTPRTWKNGDVVTDDVLRQSSAVLFECQNGNSTFIYIIGFTNHPLNQQPLGNDLGHYWQWNFNGISSLINKDGEYSVTFVGNILDEGTNLYREIPDTTGTFIKLDKSGAFVADNIAGESIKLDKANSQLSIVGRTINQDSTQGDWNSHSAGKTNIQADGNAVFNSGQKIYIGSEGSDDPLVLGNKLTDALEKLFDILLNAPAVCALGAAPVIWHPLFVRPQLMAWKQIYAKRNTSPFLSRKGFVE